MRALLWASCWLVACASTPSPGPALPEGRVSFRLIDLDGQPLTLAGLRGRPVLVTIINTWSPHVALEVPLYKALYDKHGQCLEILAVTLDEDPRMGRIFRDTFEIPYRVAGAGDLAQFTGPSGPFGPIGIVPTSVLLDREGRISARMDGMWPRGALTEAIEHLCPSTSPQGS